MAEAKMTRVCVLKFNEMHADGNVYATAEFPPGYLQVTRNYDRKKLLGVAQLESDPEGIYALVPELGVGWKSGLVFLAPVALLRGIDAQGHQSIEIKELTVI